MMPLTDNSLRTAALVLHGLSHEQASRIRARLAPQERQRLEAAVAQLAQVASGEILDALERLAREAAKDLVSEAARDPLREIAKRGESSVADEVAETRGLGVQSQQEPKLNPGQSPLAFLRHVEPSLLAKITVDEHPEDIAIVLAELPSQSAADLLQQFDPILRFSVLRRMCRLEKVNLHRAEELAFILKQRLNQKLGTRTDRDLPESEARGLAAAARAVSLVEPRSRRELLQQLRVVDGELADEVSAKVFEFADLDKLSNVQIALLLKRANTAWWAPALGSAQPELRERILGCMATKAAAILKREIKALGEVPPKVAERSQQEIVSLWLRLTGDV